MQPGTTVICIDDTNWSPDSHELFSTLPVRNGFYTVRRVIPNLEARNGPEGIALEDIFGAWHTFHCWDGRKVFDEYHFRKNRFREVPPDEVIETRVYGLSSIDQPLELNLS